MRPGSQPLLTALVAPLSRYVATDNSHYNGFKRLQSIDKPSSTVLDMLPSFLRRYKQHALQDEILVKRKNIVEQN